MNLHLDLNRISFARYANRELKQKPAKQLYPEYTANLIRFAPIICDFARTVLEHEMFRGQQLMFLGKSMDLVFHAAVFLACMNPHLRERYPDLYLIDFSRGLFYAGFPKDPMFPKIRKYLEGCGLDLARKIAIIDDVYLSGNTIEFMKDILWAAQPFCKSAVFYKEISNREDGAHPNFEYERYSSFDPAETREAVKFLSSVWGTAGIDIYDPARTYKVETSGGKMFPVYHHLNFPHWTQTRREFMQICLPHLQA